MNNRREEQNQKLDKKFKEFLKRMVMEGIDNKFIEEAEEYGEYLVKTANLTTTQIRRIFGHVKKIENFQEPKKFIPQLLMLKPMLAYTAKRHESVGFLQEVLENAIDAVTDTTIADDNRTARFRLFCAGFEAILAYHKAKGGKD
ncbi:MAG TPA: type III-A CRISPR-associated protein Csm2 [Candidatus Hydrogenedens sp.]|nr:type III-A CRISPR-associated protein Csm2 [Candidatus Hydrogenedens sp.]